MMMVVVNSLKLALLSVHANLACACAYWYIIKNSINQIYHHIVCATWNAVQCFALSSVSKAARLIKKIS